jgi:hypothetical protein
VPPQQTWSSAWSGEAPSARLYAHLLCLTRLAERAIRVAATREAASLAAQEIVASVDGPVAQTQSGYVAPRAVGAGEGLEAAPVDHLVACGAALAVDTHLRGATDLAAAVMVAANLIVAAGVVATDPTIAGAAERLLEAAGVTGTALSGWGASRAAALGDAVGTDAIEAVT